MINKKEEDVLGRLPLLIEKKEYEKKVFRRYSLTVSQHSTLLREIRTINVLKTENWRVLLFARVFSVLLPGDPAL